jgi:hypothetical protein
MQNPDFNAGRSLVRSNLSLRSFELRVPALRLCAATMLIAAALPAQDPAPAAQAPAAPAPPVASTGNVASTGKKATVPDYPDPRTITVGVFYWLAIPGTGPDIIGGKAATAYETLNHLGKEHFAPGIYVSVPITRTGEIKFEGFLPKGTGSQTNSTATTVFSVGYNKGEYLATQYQIQAGKLYLDDLLYPYKFPVSKFRLKSLWEVQYIGIKGTVDGPLAPTTDSSGNAVTNTGTGSRNIIFPTFGIAAEYAVSPHILLRAAGSGFGVPHRAEIWDAEGTVGYRRNNFEFRVGYKALHFKTSPQKDEYFTDTLSGGFVGVLYHWQ